MLVLYKVLGIQHNIYDQNWTAHDGLYKGGNAYTFGMIDYLFEYQNHLTLMVVIQQCYQTNWWY